MSRIEDFITQVHNPGDQAGKERDSESQSQSSDGAAAPTAPPESQRRSSSLSCCGAGKKGSSSTKTVVAPSSGAAGDSTSGNKKPSLAIPKVGGGLALNTAAAGELPRDLINSPRGGGGPKATAPYRDDALLPPISPRKEGTKCLVLDLDETLVHSSFKPVDRCDFIVPVEIEGRVHQVYVAKRPFVDDFMKRMGELYEIVVFTASLAKYADPVLDLLDVHKVVDHRLFRESCSCFKGSYVKDMGRMGRELNKIMILDNSPHSYAFNPENAIPCESWFNDYEDTELRELTGIFEQLADPAVDDVMVALEKMKISAPVSLSTDESDSGSYEESDEETGSDQEEED